MRPLRILLAGRSHYTFGHGGLGQLRPAWALGFGRDLGVSGSRVWVWDLRPLAFMFQAECRRVLVL